MENKEVNLKRVLGIWQLLFYGLGTMIGAGIYVLIGKVSGISGLWSPFAFLLAGIIAGFSAFSYAELTARYPKSAGEVEYADKAFGIKWISLFVGFCILFTGIVSAAAILLGFLGYLEVFVLVPKWLGLLILLIILGGLSIWGVAESITLLSIITILEIIGLIVVIGISWKNVSFSSDIWDTFNSLPTGIEFKGILGGAFLAFFAFIGFEDLANITEEAKNPRKNVPLAIILSLIITTILYILLSIVAIFSLPIQVLENSSSPLKDIVETSYPNMGASITIISLIAIVNGALAQIIMSSRVIYGMAKKRLMPAFFGKVSPRFQTPVWATLSVTFVIYLLGIGLDILTLAEWTSLTVIILFSTVNLSLLVIKLKYPAPAGIRTVSILVPICGILLGVFLLVFSLLQ